MPYRLIQLAPGSYDIELDGKILASLVHLPGTRRRAGSWVAELLNEGVRPTPFVSAEHEFPTFEDAVAWLGDAEVTRPHAISRV
jgi:hypothetical protein